MQVYTAALLTRSQVWAITREKKVIANDREGTHRRSDFAAAGKRAIVADSVLRSLNVPEPEMDRKWAQIAQRRLAELRSGEVKPIPGKEVFANIWKRFEA